MDNLHPIKGIRYTERKVTGPKSAWQKKIAKLEAALAEKDEAHVTLWRKAHARLLAIIPKHPDPQINRMRAEVGPANVIQLIEDVGHYLAEKDKRIRELEETLAGFSEDRR
jgi:hypothetical protein